MSIGSCTYEDFLRLPRRVFLDSSILHNVHKYGEAVFDNQQLRAEEHIRKWEHGPAEITALRNLLFVSRRGDFQFAVSRSSLKEVAAKQDSGFLDWSRDVLRCWEQCLACTGLVNPSKAETLSAQLDTERFDYLSGGDRALLRDAVAVGCDGFLTMDFKLRKNSPHLQRELNLKILSPSDYWTLILPWAALYV